MLQENAEMELSINNAKVMAREKQPIRHDVYLQHISHYEDYIKTLKNIINKMSEQESYKNNTTNFFSSINCWNKRLKS